MRRTGLRVEVYPEADKLGNSATPRPADRFITVVGDERAAGQVTVKNMQNGEQTIVVRDQAASWLAERTLNLNLNPVLQSMNQPQNTRPHPYLWRAHGS
jgi:hypothetical protein